ncbi:hypothetical protein [Cellulomonas denverensis]|uniref:Uncharacterized protein n=1 Tax=Cellulomonas denverensis TaxID=264297 RepID=A0A7X6KSV9_9CELL|nr:hypothetical protein [Cellulomonas denverensis]NKY21349.1 hypothetical protein [Cellulomonas denverensis]GIG27329.1 hypothetical protein Cde04nite_35730 [Cellulomonas denverensis]
MNEQHGQDEAFARLRASDPAADARLDREALRQEVDRRIAGTGTTAPGEPGEDAVEVATVTPIRRPARWWQAVAAVAAIAVVGGAGYAVGRGSDGPVTATPLIELASGGTGTEQATAAMDTRMWSPGRVVFSAADGLGDQPGRARAWALDPGAVTAETVAALAAALGVTGEPVQQDGSWQVGSQDGSGPGVTVYADGTAAVNYYDPDRDPWTCAQAADAGQAAEAEQTIDPVAPCEPATGGAPGAEVAEAALRDVLTAVGLDPAEFQFSHQESGGGAGSFVSAERVIDGQSTGLTWSATVVADGVQSLSGQLAPLVDLGEYDVIGATSAVQRMADPRFGSGYAGVMPLATADTPALSRTLDSTAEAAPVTESTVPPAVTPGAAIDWPVQQVTITEARLGLSQVVQSDGAVLLAPAYEFTGDDGGVWGVIAVAESALSFG